MAVHVLPSKQASERANEYEGAKRGAEPKDRVGIPRAPLVSALDLTPDGRDGTERSSGGCFGDLEKRQGEQATMSSTANAECSGEQIAIPPA
jgi:hypothetical protein